tara:strand:- start:1257 stop:3608 length:2352 start_codon:yes stop_codon:yes gene_type:complete
MNKEQLLKEAFNSYSQGNILDAANYYKEFINQGCNDHKVYSNYALILKKIGNLKDAEISLRIAIKLNPDFPETHYNLGNLLRDLGKLNAAELSTRKAIELNPNFAPAHYNLGIILIDLGKLKEAELSTRKAIELNPNSIQAFLNLTTILRDLGKLKEAELFARKTIELNPNYSLAYCNLGTILIDLGNFQEAESYTRKAIEINPGHAASHSNLGNILRELGKLKEAEFFTRKAIEINPNYEAAHLNLGNIFRELGKLKEAEFFTRKAIQVKFDFVEAHNNLGTILMALGKFKEAELSIRKAIKFKPNYAMAYSNLGSLFKDLGRLDEAKNAYQKCLDISPKDFHHMSNLIEVLSINFSWDEIEKYFPYFKHIGIEGKAVNPMNFMYLEDDPEIHLKRAIKFNKNKRRESLINLSSNKKNEINIGYFSSDFKNHPISISLIRVLELHNKAKFKIYAYSLSQVKDNFTEKIKNSVFCFREISELSDIEIVNLARNDQLDIAIDLNGYTKFNRVTIFSHRVAPIQINYFGFTGSTGSDSFDYILADKILIPEKNQKYYSEKVLYLPNSAVPSIPDDYKANVSSRNFTREQLGLPADGFVFTCFNNIRKITRKEFKVWMNLLLKVEKSVLWLIKPNNSAKNNILSEVANHGIDKKRVIFAEIMSLDNHLLRHTCGDLFLDTFNFNAGITASIALSSGMPIITLQGQSYPARMTSSMLNACKLNQLITCNYKEYESLAYELATNKEKLNNIRIKLKDKRNSSFFDSYQFTRQLEKIYISLITNNEHIE